MSMALRNSKAGCLKVIEYDRGLQSADILEIVPPLKHLMFAPLEPHLPSAHHQLLSLMDIVCPSAAFNPSSGGPPPLLSTSPLHFIPFGFGT